MSISSSSALLTGMALLMLGAGLQGTLLGLRASLEFTPLTTGFVMGSYYFGYMAGSLAAPFLIRRVGHIRVFSAFTAVASTVILVHALFVHPAVWAALRFISGVCFSGIYVVAESWINGRASNENRGRLLAVYMAVTYSGLALGQLLLNVSPTASIELFILVCVLISLAVVPVALSVQRAPEYAVPGHLRLRDLYRISPLGIVAITGSGMLTGTLFAMGPIYAHAVGLTVAQVAIFMSLSIFAAVLLHPPIGRLSDRVDRRNILIIVCCVAGTAAIVAMALLRVSHIAVIVAAAVYGGLSMTIYSLALAHVNDHLPPSQMVAASSSLLLINGAGAALSPILVSPLMASFGPQAYLAFFGGLHVVLAAYALWRKGLRAPVPASDKHPFVIGVQPQATPTGRMVATIAEGTRR